MRLKSCQNDQNFVDRGRKDQAAFSPFVLSSGTEEVGQNWNGKTPQTDQRSVSDWGELEWKGCGTSAGAWDATQLRIF